MGQYVVTKTELNKFGFGTVHLDGGGELHAKGRYGFGIGKKSMPPCVTGDLIEGDIGQGQYAEIRNIKVIGKAPKKAQASKSSEFRSPQQLMRTTAVEFTIANADSPLSVEEIMLFSDEIYQYIDKGNSPVNVGDTKVGTPTDDDYLKGDDIPF